MRSYCSRHLGHMELALLPLRPARVHGVGQAKKSNRNEAARLLIVPLWNSGKTFLLCVICTAWYRGRNVPVEVGGTTTLVARYPQHPRALGKGRRGDGEQAAE